MRRLLVLPVLLALITTPALSAPRFRVVDLGFVPGGTASRPTHFGSTGVVLGGCDVPGTFGGHATRWDVSPAGALLATTDLLGLAGFNGSLAMAMNASGSIAGYSNDANPQPRAVLWRGGSVLDIENGADHNANIYAMDVNDAGVVCGFLTKSGGGAGWDAAIWTERQGQPTRFVRANLPLHPSADPVTGWTESQSIDELGRVFGRTNLGLGGDRATLWLADAAHTPVLLEPLSGSIQSMPGAINDLGDAVGYTIRPFSRYEPTRWSRDAAHTPSALPLWPGYNSGAAYVVNPAGDVVLGLSQLIDTQVFPPAILESRVVMWDQGAIYDLNARLDASGSGWTLTEARDMNADGWIAATAQVAGVEHAVVLIPVPDNTAVGPEAIAGLSLSRPSPNPARGTVHLAFALPHEGPVRLLILDAQGRRVATLVDGRLDAGRYERTWSGSRDRGTAAAEGVYFASLEADGGRTTRRIVRLK